MKTKLLTRIALLGLTASLLLSCFMACDKQEDPEQDTGKATTADTTADTGKDNENQGGSPSAGTDSKDMADIKAEINSLKVEDFTETTETSEYIKIIVKNYGEIVVRLREDVAPNTVGLIQHLLQYNYYRGLSLHRVLKDSLIQGGSPKGDGTGSSGITVKGEFSSNNVKNDLLHVRGVISLCRDEDPNGGSGQFFICVQDCPQLDGERATFGYVVAGLDVVDAIAAAEVKDNGKGEISSPVEKIVMDKIVFVNRK